MNVSSFSWKIFEKSDDIKGVTRSHQSKDRHDNGQTRKNNTTNNYLQNTTQKTNIETGRGLNSGDPDGLPVSVPLVVPVVLLLCNKP